MRSRGATGLVAAVLMSIVVLVPTARAAPPGPTLRVVAASSHVEAFRSGSGSVFFDAGVYLAVTDLPFEVRVARTRYKEPFSAWQVLGRWRHARGSARAAARPVGVRALRDASDRA